jgi:hypothetical protein
MLGAVAILVLFSLLITIVFALYQYNASSLNLRQKLSDHLFRSPLAKVRCRAPTSLHPLSRSQHSVLAVVLLGVADWAWRLGCVTPWGVGVWACGEVSGSHCSMD